MKQSNILIALLLFLFCASKTNSQWIKVSSLGITYSFLSTETSILVSSSDGIYKSTDSGTTWRQSSIGLSNTYGGYLQKIGQNIFDSIDNVVYQSTNGGSSWEILYTFPDTMWVNAFVQDSGILYLAMYQGIYKSLDYGKSWVCITPPFGYKFTSICISNGKIFAGSNGNGVYFSSDDGQNWKQLNNHMDFLFVQSLACCGDNVITGEYLLKENDSTWTQTTVTGNVHIVESYKDNIFAGTQEEGVWLSTSNGVDWQNISLNLPDTINVFGLKVIGDYLFAGTYKNGIWRIQLSQVITSVNNINPSLIANYELYQNYPNPFNPSTTIKYQLPASGNVTLKIFDILGREVATLVNEFQAAGSYARMLNAASLSSGVYFYRLQTCNYSATKKFVLMK